MYPLAAVAAPCSSRRNRHPARRESPTHTAPSPDRDGHTGPATDQCRPPSARPTTAPSSLRQPIQCTSSHEIHFLACASSHAPGPAASRPLVVPPRGQSTRGGSQNVTLWNVSGRALLWFDVCRPNDTRPLFSVAGQKLPKLSG